jgi:hypothetical protein
VLTFIPELKFTGLSEFTFTIIFSFWNLLFVKLISLKLFESFFNTSVLILLLGVILILAKGEEFDELFL